MTEIVPPKALWAQTLLLLALGIGGGYAATALGSADFSILDPPRVAVGSGELDRMLTGDGSSGAGEATAPPGDGGAAPSVKMVGFLDIMTKLYGNPTVTFVDARDEPSFEQGHIPGAIPLDHDKALVDPTYRDSRERHIPRDHVVVVYCGGGECDLSRRLAASLLSRGYRNVLVYEGGWTEWQAEGGEKASGGWSPPAGEDG